MRPPRALLLTCEHGGNRVPRRYAALFAPHRALLATHRGYDLGALDLARALARQLGAPLVAATTTRLLVDLNRSVGHPKLFSAMTQALPRAEREQLLARYYHPHRARVLAHLRDLLPERGRLARCPVIHVAVHSFTPVLDGHVRQAEIGLLYDPRRPAERRFATAWAAALRRAAPELRVRMNYPYRGVSDGLPPACRRLFRPRSYAGFELEVNQALLTPAGRFPPRLARLLAATLAAALAAK